MALIKCSECGGKVSDKASSCPHCGCPVDPAPSSEFSYCPYCGKRNRATNSYCATCGKSMTGERAEENPAGIVTTPQPVKDITQVARAKQLESEQRMIQQEQARIFAEQRRQFELAPRCPKCGSTSLSCGKRGYGVGKAAAGAILAGPIGFLAGGIGMHDTEITCMSCGCRWTVKSN